ncbi:MAG: hypothetical protein JO359_12155 [Candidatus Eremiobacteraeota bacterium]|nr:hypothetical protein [Candidatus Eremiobacteraeota bacterium]
MFLLEFDSADLRGARSARTAFLAYLQRETHHASDLAPAETLFSDLVTLASGCSRWLRVRVIWRRDGTGTITVADPNDPAAGCEAALPLRRRLVAS